MKFQLRRLDLNIFEVYDSTTGNPHFRGPLTDAAKELSRLNTAATPLPTMSERKAARMRRIEERRQAGHR